MPKLMTAQTIKGFFYMQTSLNIVEKTIELIKTKFTDEYSGHDIWHILRVRNTALEIHKYEGGNKFIIEMAALLHDIADAKFYNGDINIGAKKTIEWLNNFDINENDKLHIADIVKNISFKGKAEKNQSLSLEGQIVQDADRLDAIGAIGIARVFAYSGASGRLIYDPTEQPIKNHTTESYFKNKNTAINHFYEKLLLLKDLMNTNKGKHLAEIRHNFMLSYLEQFYSEIGDLSTFNKI